MSAANPFRDPSAVLAEALGSIPLAERGQFLRELLAHAAAGLVMSDGAIEAVEEVYRLADAVLDRAGQWGGWRDVVKVADAMGFDAAKIGRAIRRAERNGLSPTDFFAVARDRFKRSRPVISFVCEGGGYICVTPKRIWREGAPAG